MKYMFKVVLFFMCNLPVVILAQVKTEKDTIPNTGISGLYEVMLATDNAGYAIKYFGEYGFTIVDSAVLKPADVLKLYGINTGLKSYRLQNGEIDSHGLLRLLVWDKPLGPGVGYTIPETIGSRMTVMKTDDIVRIEDVYKMLRANQEKWLPTTSFFDDPLRINKNGATDFFKRPVGVRENAVYGDFFTHVFFQRYGYTIPGYGTINPKAPLKTSEFTHHDFFIKVPDMGVIMYLQHAFGLKAEKEPELDGDFLKGAKVVFNMTDGYTHMYQGFVSPNNICGKLKFFIPQGPKPDASARQRIGELGVTLHSFYTPKINMVLGLVKKHKLFTTEIFKNEYGENSFICRGPEGISWQIIEKTTATKNTPVTKFKIEFVNN
jgi:hypothetical protein